MVQLTLVIAVMLCAYYHTGRSQSMESTCGGTETTLSGSIASPNHPNYHPSCIACIWTIPVPNRDCTVRLDFTSFAMEGTGNEYVTDYEDCDLDPRSDDYDDCLYDYVSIYDIDGSSIKYCGNDSPGQKTTTGQTEVYFFADQSYEETGFSLDYSVTCPGDDVEPTFFAPSPSTFRPGDSIDFQLEVKVYVANLSIPFIFEGMFYLSEDPNLDPGDVHISYPWFDYEPAKSERERNLSQGAHTLNLEGCPLDIPDSAAVSALCGQKYLLYFADSGNTIDETDENNNNITAKVIILCADNLLQLMDFSFSVPETLAADHDSPISVSYDVLNVGPSLPLPSLSSPHYRLVLRSGGTILGLMDSRFPDEYYQPLPSGKRHTFKDVVGHLSREAFTQSECEVLTTLELCVERPGDTVMDHCLQQGVDPGLKDCNSTDHRDFHALALRAPSMFNITDNMTVTIEYEVTLAPQAISIQDLDFRCGLFLTHSPEDDPRSGHLLTELASEAAVSAGSTLWWRQTAKDEPLMTPADDTYCGIQYLSLLVDSGDNIPEPFETNNVVSKEVIVLCDNDIWGLGPISFDTAEGRLVESISLAYTMEISVACVKADCDLAASTDNIEFSVSYDDDNSPAQPWFSVTSTYSGTVTPSLGVSFRSGLIRHFTIQGMMSLAENICGPDRTVYITVQVGSSALVGDMVLSNNQVRVPYPCSPGLRDDASLRDLVAYPIVIPNAADIPGVSVPVINEGQKSIFTASFEVVGPPIPPQDGAPPSAPLGFGLYVSADSRLDNQDTELGYIMSDGVAIVLSDLPDLQRHTVTVIETNGFVVPPGHCGNQNILFYLDKMDRIKEAANSNNMVTTAVYVACDKNVLALTHLEAHLTGDVWPGMAQDASINLGLTNVGTMPTSPCVVFHAYLSEDVDLDMATVSGEPADTYLGVLTSDQHSEHCLMNGLMPGQTRVLEGLRVENISMTAADCLQAQYLIVIAEPQTGLQQVDDPRDNIRVVALPTHCQGAVDLWVTELDLYDGFKGQVSWENDNVKPAWITYALWLSHNTLLEPALDWRLNLEGRVVVGGDPGIEYTFLPGYINVTDTPDAFCGQVYLLGQLDVYSEVLEPNKDNNIMAIPLLIECPNDIMTLQVYSLHTSPMPIYNGAFTMNLTMHIDCYSDDNTLCLPNRLTAPTEQYIYFTLEFLDESFINVADPQPNIIDVSSTQFIDASIVQDALYTNPRDFSINGPFNMSGLTSCEDISYLRVTLVRGDALSTNGIILGPAASKVRLVPITLECDTRGVDLRVDSVGVGGNPKVVDLSSRNMSISLSVSATNLPPNPNPDFPNFHYILRVKSSTPTELVIENLGYVPGPGLQNALSGDLVTSTIDLSEFTETLDWDKMRAMCDRNDLKLTVTLDPENVLREEDRTNNYKESDDTFSIVNCDVAIDVMVPECSIDSHSLVSGDTIDIHARVQIIRTGLPDLPDDWYPDYYTTFHLVDKLKRPTLEVALDCGEPGAVTPSTTEVHSSRGTNVQDHWLDNLSPISIPPDTAICDKAWFLRVGAFTLSQQQDRSMEYTPLDRSLTNNYCYAHVYIKCIPDQISLLDITVSSIPDQIWPLANNYINFKTTIVNRGAPIPAPSGDLFRLNSFFAPQNTWDMSDGSLIPDEVGYSYSGGLDMGGMVQTPSLRGILRPTLADCQAAKAQDACPTFFVQLIQSSSNAYSRYSQNDVLKVPIERDRFVCNNVNVDLSVWKLESRDIRDVWHIYPNTETQYTLKINQARTASGSIPASDDNSPSYNFNFYLSSDPNMDQSDHMVPLTYTSEQIAELRKGVGPDTPSTIILSGANLYIDIVQDPLLTHYCGKSYLCVKVQDLKNLENIDPILSNNHLCVPIDLRCRNDVISVEDASLTLCKGHQRQWYAKVSTTFCLYIKITYLVDEPLPDSVDRNIINIRIFVSTDAILDYYNDIELDTNLSGVEGLRKGFEPQEEREVKGDVILYLGDLAADKFDPNYIIILVMIGGQQVVKEDVILNNFEAISLSGLYNSSRDTDDLVLSQFNLTSGATFSVGSEANYSLSYQAVSTYDEDTSENRRARLLNIPKFQFTIYLSEDDLLDEGDLAIFNFTISYESNTLEGFKFVIPPFLEPRLCGNIYLLAVLDSQNQVWEKDESNNLVALAVTTLCPYDVARLVSAPIFNPETVYYKNPGTIILSLYVDIFTGETLNFDYQTLTIQLLAKRPGGKVAHDISPSTPWTYGDGENVDFNKPLVPGMSQNFPLIRNKLDLSAACSAAHDPLVTGSNDLTIKVIVGDRKRQVGHLDGEMGNNVIHTVINADCGASYLDLSIKDFHLGQMDNQTTLLHFGYNPFVLNALVTTSSASAYNNLIGPDQLFNYKFRLFYSLKRTLYFNRIATEITKNITDSSLLHYDTSGHHNDINRFIQNQDTLLLSDTEMGLEIELEDFFKLCLAHNLSISITLDADMQVAEADESNNANLLTSLVKPDGPLCEGQDFAVKQWAVRDLRFDLLHHEQIVPYTLLVHAYLSGTQDVQLRYLDGLDLNGTRRHFEIVVFLSWDKKKSLDAGDDVLLDIQLSSDQDKVLKDHYSGFQELVVDGELSVPIDSSTYPYCWQPVTLGVFINSTIDEVTIQNNYAFYNIIFDCGNDIDECVLGLSDCHPNATCKNERYSYYDPCRGDQVNSPYCKPRFSCTCKPGFGGNGTFCENIDECREVGADGNILHDCDQTAHFKCVDTAGSFHCQCDKGFNEAVDFYSGNRHCLDKDECYSEENDCDEEATCTNTVGWYKCTCRDGFTGNGTHCTNIDDCEGTICQNGGTCYDHVLGFTCVCPSPTFKGQLCEVVDGSWGEWGAWGPCACGEATRTRECDSPSPEEGGRQCEVVGGTGNWDRRRCNTTTSDCDDTGFSPVVNNRCPEGYTLRQRPDHSWGCIDDDECGDCPGRSGAMNDCDQDLGVCTNTAGSYRCSCLKGYVLEGRRCTDIDECARQDHGCDVNAKCVNEGGSYECVCKEGYKKEKLSDPLKGTCILERLLPYGLEVGDEAITRETTLYPGEVVSHLIPVPHGLPLFGQSLAETVYISENGVIVATRATVDTARINPYKQSEDLETKTFSSEEKVRAIIAPWWTDCELKEDVSSIWYQNYTRPDKQVFPRLMGILMNLGLSHVTPEFVLKVTWQNMAPYYRASNAELSTFQAILFTNNKHTYVIYLYDSHQMTWNPQYLPERPYASPAIGFAVTSDRGHSVNHLEHLGNDIYSPDKVIFKPHITNDTGIVAFRLDDNDVDYVNPRRYCIDWFAAEPDVETWAGDLLGTCPHHLAQAQADRRMVGEDSQSLDRRCFERAFSTPTGANIRCCYSFETGAILNKDAVHLCLNPKTEFYNYGFLYRYPKDSTPGSLHYLNDWRPYQMCCRQSPKDHINYAQKYTAKRPLADSDRYDPLVPALVHGGVHYRSFGGHIQSFNGFGEYVACKSNIAGFYIEMQTRHSRHQASKDYVYLSGVAIRVGSEWSPVLEIYSGSANTVDVFYNKTVWTPSHDTPDIKIEMLDAPGSRGVALVFREGVVLEVMVNQTRLRALLLLPESLHQGQRPQGTSCSVRPHLWPERQLDGLLATNSSCHNESCSLPRYYGSSEDGTNANTNTLFSRYAEYMTYPKVINSALEFHWKALPHVDTLKPNATIEDRCRPPDVIEYNEECKYDEIASANPAVGSSTLYSALQYNQMEKLLCNSRPIFENGTQAVVEVWLNKEFSVTVVASEPGGSVLSFFVSLLDNRRVELLDSDKQMPMTVHGPNGYKTVFNHTIGNNIPLMLTVIAKASDGVQSIYSPLIVLCVCENGGTYVTTRSQSSLDSDGSMVASCVCGPGWTGDFCETPLDGCSINPCYTKCTDNVELSEEVTDVGINEFKCAPCDDGMDGDGQNCYELNECELPQTDSRKAPCVGLCIDQPNGYLCDCEPGFDLVHSYLCEDQKECALDSTNDCDHQRGTCEDEPEGSYTCGCEIGYTLGVDNVCVDVDECIECEPDEIYCQHSCHNTDGSYQCSCDNGYRQSITKPSQCLEIDECAEGFHDCDMGCSNTAGSYVCTCLPEFELQPDGSSCIPLPQFMCPFGEELCTHDSRAICSEIAGRVNCHCPHGYLISSDREPVCEDVNECATRVNNCEHPAFCVNTNGTYRCECVPGFTIATRGSSECTDVDECKTNPPCKPCVNTYGSYYCACPPGFYHAEDGHTCLDLNECERGQLNPCEDTSTCINTNGSYVCVCKQGYHKVNGSCVDIKDCGYTDVCADKCEDIPGDYRCFCSQGYVVDPQDHTKCLDVDESVLPDAASLCTHYCVNEPGSYRCTCRDGYNLDLDRKTCNPINGCEDDCGYGKCRLVSGQKHCECFLGFEQLTASPMAKCVGIDECMRANPCDTLSSATCLDILNGSNCTCEAGYTTSVDGLSCIDLDECTLNIDGCNKTRSTCYNLDGGYECICKFGFEKNSNDQCKDINECSAIGLQNPHCANYDVSECINLPGSYRCECLPGFVGNGTFCADWDECQDKEERCDRMTEMCENTVGSYHCVCKPGYQDITADGNCQNINECDSPILNECKSQGTCEDLPGSFRCRCPEGEVAMNDGVSCQALRPCSRNATKSCGALQCKVSGDSYVCVCPISTQGSATDDTCEDIDECAYWEPCRVNSHSTCVNLSPGFECRCDEPWLPDPDGLGCSQTPGAWSEWGQWGECSHECGGTTIRRRQCNNPAPVGFNRTCPGSDEERDLCVIGHNQCIVKGIENAMFVDIEGLDPTLFCEMEEPLKSSIVQALNIRIDHAMRRNETYKTYCGKDPRSDQPIGPVVQESDVVTTCNYPRPLNDDPSNTRMLYAIDLARFCNAYQAHHVSKRSVPETGETIGDSTFERNTINNDTIFLPNNVLNDALNYRNERNQSYFDVFLAEALYDARLRHLIGEIHVTTQPAFNEDGQKTTTPSMVPLSPNVLPPYAIVLIVLFSALVIVIIIVIVLLTLHSAKKKKDSNAGSSSPIEQEQHE